MKIKKTYFLPITRPSECFIVKKVTKMLLNLRIKPTVTINFILILNDAFINPATTAVNDAAINVD